MAVQLMKSRKGGIKGYNGYSTDEIKKLIQKNKGSEHIPGQGADEIHPCEVIPESHTYL